MKRNVDTTMNPPESLQNHAMGEISQMLQRVINGEAEACAWLYDFFAPYLFNRLKQRYDYLCRPDLEDLLHDSFVLFLRNRGKVLRDFMDRVPEKEQTVTALARRLWDLTCGLVSNYRRYRKLRRFMSLTQFRETPIKTDPEQQNLNRDTLDKLEACLQKKGLRISLYFKLRYRDGFTPEEIAHMNGWSRKATYKLKQALNEAVSQCAKKLGIFTN